MNKMRNSTTKKKNRNSRAEYNNGSEKINRELQK